MKYWIKTSLLELFVIMVCLSLSGCKKDQPEPCKNEWTTFRIDSGEHYSKPRYFDFYTRDQVIRGCALPNDRTMYDLGDNDQYDWNKLRGFRFGYSNTNGVPHKSSIVAWRWNTEGWMEYAPYFNNYPSNLIQFPDSSEIIKGYLFEVIHFERSYQNGVATIKIWNQRDSVSKSIQFNHSGLYYSVGWYFGGNRTANRDLEINISE